MEINNNKKSKRSIHPDVAFENLTPSQKSLYKQNSLPIVINNNSFYYPKQVYDNFFHSFFKYLVIFSKSYIFNFKFYYFIII